MTGSTDKKNESFINLFTSYFWLGIVLVLVAIIIDLQFPKKEFYITTITLLCQSIGIAIIVASIFTYVSGTSEFINKISALLQDIVVNRNFLGNIDPESKREALNALIKPSSEERKVYSNIEDYLNTYITQTMDVTKKCVRSNYVVNAHAYLKNGKVIVDSNISYRLYPTKDGYSNIKVGFLEHELDSDCNNVVVNTPHGDREIFNTLDFLPVEIDAGKARIAEINLSKYAKVCSHLDISLDMSEAGSDHWNMLSFSALMPTDGFKHSLTCHNNLKINQYHTFIHGAQYYVDKTTDDNMVVTCTEWINEGTGISILISLPHTIDFDTKIGVARN